ncbi:MAG: hypothetical protein WC349_02870 [Patescibacteria group bacterium]|jgi:hypothetical protein
MDIKKNSPSGEAENKDKMKLVKARTNLFLMDYFNFIIFALAVVIMSIGLFIFVYPKYQQIHKENEEIQNNLQVEYEAKFNYLSSIRDLKEIYQLISDKDKSKINSMLPTNRDTSVIIAEIESIATKNGVILNSIQTSTQETSSKTNTRSETKSDKASLAGIFNQSPQGVGSIKIEVKLSSVNYQVLKNIIKTFENNLRIFDIATVNFNVNKKEAIFTIYSYYFQ